MAILGPLNPWELARSAKAAAATASRRLRPDHLAIRQRAVQWHLGAPMTHFFLYAVVAPSRSAPRPFDDGQVRRARAFATAAFPGVFGDTPAWADDRHTLFAVQDADGSRLHQLYVHRSGLVELLWALTPHTSDDSAEVLLLDATEIANVANRLATAVATDSYREISRAGRGRRRFARVDWWFQLTSSTSDPEGQRHWTGLRFPHAAPPRAAHQWPATPLDGYAGNRLSGARRRSPAGAVANVLLSELVTANGYYDFAACLEQTIAASLSPPPSSAPALRAGQRVR